MPRASFSQQEAALFFRQARRVARHPALDVLLMRCSGSEPKLVVVTSRRIGNAPARNKIRRRIKAFFHESSPVSSAYDCAVIVKTPALALSYTELTSLITSLLASYAVS